MKIGRWQRRDGIVEAGFIHDKYAVPLRGGVGVETLIMAGLPQALASGKALIDDTDRSSWRELDSVRLLAPLVPSSVRDFLTFEQHVEGMVKRGGGPDAQPAAEWYQAPTFYFTNPHTVIGPTDTLTPPQTAELDFELEVAAVIGAVRESDGRSMSITRSHDQIFGYTIFNDWSARDLQAREMRVQLGPCKGKDFASTVGPWIVTADELEEYHDEDGFLELSASVTINGEHFGADSTANMSWTFAEMIAYASRDSRVAPGDLLASGTIGGGCLAEAWGRAGGIVTRPLQAGDTVTLNVEGIGELSTVVGHPREQQHPIPVARNLRFGTVA